MSGPPPTGVRPALSRLVGDVGEFATDHWGELPLLSHTPGFTDLFGPGAVDELVTVRGLRSPFLRMAREGTLLAPSAYTGGAGVGAAVTDQADSAKITAEMAQGATLVLQALHRTWPPLQAFTRQLHYDVGHPTQCNAYITPPKARGFDAHYDTHDVFVLQVHGTKRWHLHRPVVEHPRKDQPWEQYTSLVAEQASTEPSLTTTLTPGDCLYIPRGWLHSATTTDLTSIHLTMGVHTVTGAEVLAAAVDRLVSDHPSFRANLPLGTATDPAALAEACTQVLKEAQAAWADVAPVQVSDLVAAGIRSDQAPAPVAPLTQLDTAADLTADHRVHLRDGLMPRLSTTGDRVRLTAGGRFVEAPARCGAALQLVATGTVVSAAGLPDVDAAAALALIRQALRQGIVIPVVD